MAARHLQAAVQAKAISQDEADMLAEVDALRPRSWWRALVRTWKWATGTISREEFDAACERVRAYLDGRPMTPEDVSVRARKLLIAYTDAEIQTTCVKAGRTETALLIVWLGSPRSGFWFCEELKLKSNRGR